MQRRRYHQKEKTAGKAERGQKTHAPVWHGANPQRSVYRCFEDGFVTYEADDAREKTVCFTGHRCLTSADHANLAASLPEALEKLYETGYRFFLCGGALGFDTFAALEVLRLKKRHADVRLKMALPCPSQPNRWSSQDQRVYWDLLRSADVVLYISDAYYEGCMQKRNRYLVDHASLCVCYLKNCRGGTWYTVSYAYDQQVRILNLLREGKKAGS